MEIIRSFCIGEMIINIQLSKMISYIVTRGHFDWDSRGMRISKYTHKENSGGLTSRGNLDSETVLWHGILLQ